LKYGNFGATAIEFKKWCNLDESGPNKVPTRITTRTTTTTRATKTTKQLVDHDAHGKKMRERSVKTCQTRFGLLPVNTR
jgi:hypothetical protein